MRRHSIHVLLVPLLALASACSRDTGSEAGDGSAEQAVETVAVETSEPAAPDATVVPIEVAAGDTLEGALTAGGLERPQAMGLVQALTPFVDMRRVRPGETLLARYDLAGQLESAEFRRNRRERYTLLPGEDGTWQAAPVDVPIEERRVLISGTLEGSLFATLDRLGEGPQLTQKLIELFEWDIDFATVQQGDRFRMLADLRYADGDFLEYGDLAIAQYAARDGQVHTAVGFADPATGEIAYYDASGHSTRKMFLKAPLNFTRISSGFTHARHHPILGVVRPHLAIDYAAPTGTPVRAVAAGTVQLAGRKGGNGNCVVLRHARGYETMYNHLSRIDVRRGQRVEQGQQIGRVGSTGLSTGPHLDYRVKKDGRWVNPLAEQFVPGEPVPVARRAAFERQLGELVARLDELAPFHAEAPLPTVPATAAFAGP